MTREAAAVIHRVHCDSVPILRLARAAIGRPAKKRLVATLVVALASLQPSLVRALEQGEAVASRPDKTFVLFRPAATPASVPLSAAEDLRTPPPWHQVVHARWVQMNDFDPAAARSGDRVIFEVSAGESYELVLTDVARGYGGRTVWRGKFPGGEGIPFQASFTQDGRSISRVSLALEGSKRVAIAKVVRDLPGWNALQDLVQSFPALGPHEKSRLGDDVAKPLPPKRTRPAEPREGK